MAFRIQDLMMDVRPGAQGARGARGGYQMANPECTCQITVRQEREIAQQDEEPEAGPDPEPGSDDSFDGPPEKSAHPAGLALLRTQLRAALAC